MKNVILFAILLFSTTLLTAQNASSQSQETDEQKAHIDFESTLHDFGQIVVNSNASCEFKFTNTGKEPLILSNVKASCGCTVPEWTKEPVLPGEEGVIKVRYTTVTRPNVINKAIIVHSNADNKQVILRIKGEVVPQG
jgi:hypothetical protein